MPIATDQLATCDRADVILAVRGGVGPARSENGLGGFSPDGREYVIRTGAGETTPAPWVNVLANAHFGTRRVRERLRLYLGRERHEFRLTPWHNDPVTDTGGEAFYLRDEETGRFWSPTPLPSRGGGAVRDPPRLRLQRLRARRGRHRDRAVDLRRDRCAGQVLGAEAAQRVRAAAPAVRDRLCRMGAGRPARQDRDARRHRARSRDAARCSRATRTTPNSPAGCAFFDVRATAGSHASPAIAPSSWAATARCGSPAACGARAFRAASARGSIRAPRSRCRSNWPTGRSARDRVPPRRRARLRDDARSWCSGSAASAPRTRRSSGAGTTGGGRSAPCRSQRPTRRSTCWPTAGCSTRRSPAACGRAAAITSRAAPSASATSCRTRWRWCTPSRELLREHLLLVRRAASSARATCSTGGIRRWAAACARACSDDYLWLPLADVPLCRHDAATPACSTRRAPFLEGRPVSPTRKSYYDLPPRSGESRHAVRALRARAAARPAVSARTACR